MLGDITDGLPDQLDAAAAFWDGNTTSSSTNPSPTANIDPSYYQAEAYQAVFDAADAAKQEVIAAASSGRPVSPSAVDTLQSQGISLSNIMTAAGGVFKLVQSSGGGYIAQPGNTIAQQQVAASASNSKLMLIGIAALAAFFLLKH